jgi:hypothetical protein
MDDLEKILKAFYAKAVSFAKTPEDCDKIKKWMKQDIAMINKELFVNKN